MSKDKTFSIPYSDVYTIKLLSNSKIEDLQAIEKALTQEQPTFDTEALSKSISSQTKIDIETVGPIVSILWRFVIIKQRLGLTNENFFNTLILSLKGTDQWNDEDAKHLEEKWKYISKVISPDSSLGSGAKAAELMLEQHLLFCKARVLTDVRPVFDEKAEHIETFVPFHTLSIKYHKGSENKHREMHFAMDLKDIINLRDQLSRAEQKEKLARQSLTEKGLKVIKTGAESDVK